MVLVQARGVENIGQRTNVQSQNNRTPAISVNDPEADISVIIRSHAALESSLVGNSPCSGSSLACGGSEMHDGKSILQ